jgi:hypothetical protein
MDKPKALRLANELGGVSDALADEAAAELRRLHHENERLHQINQSHEMKLSVRGYEIQIEDLRLAHAELRERNAELLEALKFALENGCQTVYANEDDEIGGKGCCDELSYHPHSPDCWTIKARAAIAKAEEQK